MGTREKLFRQKLADQIESLLTSSEKVFSTEKLDRKWLDTMLKKTQELNSALIVYQFLHDLPENENLQVDFLELQDQETEEKPVEVPSYGGEILKEIEEFEEQEAEEVFEVVEEASKIEYPIIKESPISEIIEEEKVEQPKEAIIEAEKTEPITEKKISLETTKENNSSSKTPLVKEINDTISLSETSVADKLRSKSIKKLAESIALNERFLYSNELFNGNMESFKRALNELDHIASKEDAQRYIERQLRVENNWPVESETVQAFINLVERRFN